MLCSLMSFGRHMVLGTSLNPENMFFTMKTQKSSHYLLLDGREETSMYSIFGLLISDRLFCLNFELCMTRYHTTTHLIMKIQIIVIGTLPRVLGVGIC